MRQFPPALVTALDADTAIPIMLAELQFDSATVRLTDNAYSVQWGGFEWAGLGGLIAIEPIREGGALQGQDLAATLSGVPLAYVALALSETVTGRRAVIYLGALDRTTHVMVDAAPLWAGQMDQMTLVEGAQTASITLKLEHEMVDWARPAGGRYTSADQQARFPGDLGLDMIAQTVEMNVVWPRASWFRSNA